MTHPDPALASLIATRKPVRSVLCKVCGGRIAQLPRTDAEGRPTYAHVDNPSRQHQAEPGTPAHRR